MTKSEYYKHPSYGHVYGKAIKTPLGWLCWTYLTKPKDPPPLTEEQRRSGQAQGTPRFETTILINKKGNKEFCADIWEMAEGMLSVFNKGRTAKLALDEEMLFGKYGDGDTADHEKYPFYKGHWVLVARNSQVPKVVGPDKKPIEAGTVVGGTTGYLVVTPIITAHGLSFKLEVVQFVSDDGTRIGGQRPDYVELLEACEEKESKEDEESEEDEEQEEIPAPKKASKRGKEAAIDLL